MSKEKNGQTTNGPVDEIMKGVSQSLSKISEELQDKFDVTFFDFYCQHRTMDEKLDKLLLNDKTIEGLLKDINKRLDPEKKQNFTCQN